MGSSVAERIFSAPVDASCAAEVELLAELVVLKAFEVSVGKMGV